MIVIDASLAVKWYFDEAGAYEAEDVLLEHYGEIAVPDIFVAEVVGALVRRANIDKSKRPESEAAVARFMGLFETHAIAAIRSEAGTIAHAAALATGLGHPLKDCIYLALAMELGCDLLTCDAKFAVKARKVWAGVRVLGG